MTGGSGDADAGSVFFFLEKECQTTSQRGWEKVKFEDEDQMGMIASWASRSAGEKRVRCGMDEAT